MYGYHPEEKFAIDVGISLRELESAKILVRRYTGRPDRSSQHGGRRRYSRILNWYRFVRKHLPLSYVVDIHNGRQDPVWEKEYETRYSGERLPSMFITYLSRHSIRKRMRDEIHDLFASQPYPALAFFAPNFRYAPKRYERIGVELFPNLITKQQSIDILKGLIEILKSNNR